MAALNPAREDLDRHRLGDWLAARGQDEQTRRLLWDLFTVSALNTAGDDANLALAATVVKTGLLGTRDAADIGVPSIPLAAARAGCGRAADAAGAQVRLSAKVASVEVLPVVLGLWVGARFLVRLARAAAMAHAGRCRPGGTGPDGRGAGWSGPGGAERYAAGRRTRGRSSRRRRGLGGAAGWSRPGWRPRARCPEARCPEARCPEARCPEARRETRPARRSGGSFLPRPSSTCM
jgi:hypothetical protein